MPRGDAIPTHVAVNLLERALAAIPGAFLFGGTLLGAIREGRILADDWDVDLALMAHHWEDGYRALLAAEDLHVTMERRWSETPWAIGEYIDAGWLAAPSLLKIEHESGHHLDLHILTPGIDPAWAYFSGRRGGHGDVLLMRTPSALLDGYAPAVLEARVLRAPAHADALLVWCYGDWRQRVPAAQWYGSPEYERAQRHRAVYAPAALGEVAA